MTAWTLPEPMGACLISFRWIWHNTSRWSELISRGNLRPMDSATSTWCSSALPVTVISRSVLVLSRYIQSHSLSHLFYRFIFFLNQRYMTKLVTPLYNYTTFYDGPTDAHLLIYTRGVSVQWACKLAIGDCISNSVSLYSNWMSNPSNSSYA